MNNLRLINTEEGVTENEMVGWHHSLNGHEFEQTLGNSEGQEEGTKYFATAQHSSEFF